MSGVVDIEELEGRAAYDRGERWSIDKSDLWRRGWITQHMKNGPERQRRERENAFESAANRRRRHKLDPHQAFEDIARQLKGKD